MGRVLLLWCLLVAVSNATERPNILWITSEDNGQQLGCYGDEFADTPHLDRLAERGVCFDRAWSNAPICAPARTTIITGCYAPRFGAEHMRSYATPPEWLRFYPQLLRGAGYYCTNNSKEDYNLARPKGGKVWDESSGRAHWRNRPEGKPFFAVFNLTTTHESQTRKRPHTPVHDADIVPLPPFWPDTPIVRQDWAQYYDKMTEMDRRVGELLGQLEADGLTGETVVFYYGDHGPGMPRCKRSLYESGLRVPMIVAAPPKWERYAAGVAGSHTDRMVGFVDLAPTILRLAGVEPPDWMNGRAFLGPQASAPRETLFGFRGRVDERYDFSRCLRNDRWLYVRNYLTDRPTGQHVNYLFQTPMTRDWKRLFDAGELDAERSAFWRDQPAEELFDLDADPDSLHDLAALPQHQESLRRMRGLLRDEMRAISDTGFLPEPELRQLARQGAEADLIRAGRYDYEPIAAAAEAASRPEVAGVEACVDRLADRRAGVRYWGAVGLRFRGGDAVRSAAEELESLLSDPSGSCRIAAAEALALHGEPFQRSSALEVLVEAAEDASEDFYAAVQAWNVLDRLDEVARPVRERLAAIGTDLAKPSQPPGYRRMKDLQARLAEKTLADLAASR